MQLTLADASFSSLKSAGSQQRDPAAKDPKADPKQQDDSIDMLKDLIGKLEGLPSDARVLSNELMKFFQQRSLYSSDGSIRTDDLRYLYANILTKVNEANYNKETYKELSKQVTENGGMYEALTRHDGAILAYDASQGMQTAKWMSVEQFKKQGNLTALTNNEALRIRAEDNNFAFKNDIMQCVGNGVGQNVVMATIQEAMSKLGETTFKREGAMTFQEAKQQAAAEGLTMFKQIAAKVSQQAQISNGGTGEKGLESMITMDQLYKYAAVSQDNKAQIDAAMAFLWQTLPSAQKAFLKMRTQGGTDQEAMMLMMTMGAGYTSASMDVQATPITDPAKGGKGGKDSDIKESQAQLFVRGGGPRSTFTIHTGHSYGIPVEATTAPIVDSAGNTMDINTLGQLSDSQYSGILDKGQITINGEHIAPNNARYVTIDNKTLYRMWLPAKKNDQGVLVPNFSQLQEIEEAKAKCRAEGINPDLPPSEDGQGSDEALSDQQCERINAILQEMNLPVMFKRDHYGAGHFMSTDTWYPFVGVEVSAIKEAFGDAELEAIGRAIAAGAQEITNSKTLELIQSRINKDLPEGHKIEVDTNWIDHNDAIKGIAYIPLRQNYAQAAVSGKQFQSPEANNKFDQFDIATSIKQGIDSNSKISSFNDVRGL